MAGGGSGVTSQLVRGHALHPAEALRPLGQHPIDVFPPLPHHGLAEELLEDAVALPLEARLLALAELEVWGEG